MKKIIYLPVFAAFSFCFLFTGQAQIITTFAGNGTLGYSGDGGPAITAEFNFPVGMAIDKLGNIYIADYHNHRIRKVSVSGTISTFAGNGTAGYSGNGGPAALASLNYPCGLAFDYIGNLYIVDEGNNRIRKVDTSGVISTFAGNGTMGFSGDGGPAIAAAFNYPLAIAVDNNRNVYVVDITNNRIRKIDSTGIISTFAGRGVAGYSGDGGSATLAELNNPQAVAADGNGNIYIADGTNKRIRKVNTLGIISTFAGNGTAGFSGDFALATAAEISPPTGVYVDSVGSVYISDFGNNRIRKVTTSGIISTVAGNGTPGFSGDGGLATDAELYYPQGVIVDHTGNIFISDENNQRIRKVTGSVSSVGIVANGTEAINIFPNPATNIIIISSKDRITSVAISNLLGQTVYTNEYNIEKVQVDVSALPIGSYLIRINGTEVRKFMKQ